MTVTFPTTVAPTRRRAGRPRMDLIGLALAGLCLALLLGALVAVSAKFALAFVGVAGLSVLVWLRPVTAAYLIIGLTPLVAGIDRGRIVPVLRPNEALTVFCAGILTLRYFVQFRPGTPIRPYITRIELALVSIAVSSSILPLAWMFLQAKEISADDISYALVLWKFLGVYAVVRFTVKTQRHVRNCLAASIGSGVVLGTIAILQTLDVPGIRPFLLTFWAPFGYEEQLAIPRGSSTLSLPAATADVLIFNLAIAVAMLWKSRRQIAVLAGACLVFVIGTFAAGEFSSVLGLVVGLVCIAMALRRLDLLKYVPVGLCVAIIAAWPAVTHRLEGFQSAQGLPNSWIVRWYNLSMYFWPDLFSGSNVLFGVRPSARVAVLSQGTGYVWIESGYTWLLWGGGIPLFAAFCWFVRVSLRELWARCKDLTDWSAVAAVGAFTAVMVIVATMNFDPHLTYRGTADLLFALLALAAVGKGPPDKIGRQQRPGTVEEGQGEPIMGADDRGVSR
ncbi:hypothetical protein [Streptomyces sp. SID13031]|uniref:hypothetical protein n=1 Tax=Streptomyces sp. SID13031 TaxID=2706046 RepID=UPI0013CB0D23|nr:hypothetical protein [Streptomyces sp. SID13031]NEA30351.1 hypothetical protein [Streptomyces sp. SID13031]